MRYGIVGNKNVKRLPRDRIAYLDFLRVFSMIFVVMIHVVFDLFNNAAVSSSEWQIFNAYDSLSRWSVPVFVMISGALFLDSKKPFGQILKKNVLRLAIAYVVWTIIYSIICNIYYNDFNTTLDQLINGHFHMWFILMMIGLYLVTPLLRKIVEEKSTIRLFLILALIFAMFLPDLVKVLESFLDLGYGLFTIGEAHFLLTHLEHKCLAFLFQGQHTTITIEGCETRTVAIGHLRHIHTDVAATSRSFHTLGQSVRCQIEVRHNAAGLQSQESRTFRKTPGIFYWVVVPLPMQPQFCIVEIIALHDSRCRLTTLIWAHDVGHLIVFVAQHGPTVNPTHRT